MNGAAESLLEDILKQATITNANLAALLRQSAGTTGSAGGGGVASLAKSAGIAGLAVSALSAGFNLLSNTVSSITNIIGATTAQMYAFSKAAVEGTATLSQLYRVFDQLPIIGRAFSMLADLVQYQEELLKTYQQLTQSGASFSGSLYEMRNMAFSAYMTLKEFGQVVAKNSELFASAVGGVDAGLKTFTASQAKLMNPDGEFGKNLLGLGVTAGEAGDMLATYMKMQGNMTKVNRQSSDEIAASTSGLILQLDQYSKLTGESREKLAAQMKEKAFDEQLKMYLSNLSGPELAQATQALTVAMQQGGKGLQDEVAVRIMSNGQIRTAGTEAANWLRTTSKNASATSADMIASTVKMKLGSDEVLQTLQGSARALGKGTQSTIDSLGGPGKAGIMAFFGGVKFSAEQAKTVNRLSMTAAEKDAEIREGILARQQEQYKGNAAALAAAEMQIKVFGAQLGMSVLSLISKFQPALDKISHVLLSAFGGAVNALTRPDGPLDKLGALIEKYLIPVINDMVNWFSRTFISLSESNDIKDFWKRLAKSMSEAWEGIKETLAPIWEAMKPIIEDMFKGFLDMMWKTFKEWIFGKNQDPKKLAEEGQERKDAKVEAKVERASLRDQATEELMNAGIEVTMKSLADRMKEIQNRSEEADPRETDRLLAKYNASIAGRATGSLGMTGSLFENWGSGTPAMLHGQEAVVTPEQMSGIVNNSMVGELQTLNRLVADLLKYNKETADYARRNVDATKSLNGNIFAT